MLTSNYLSRSFRKFPAWVKLGHWDLETEIMFIDYMAMAPVKLLLSRFSTERQNIHFKHICHQVQVSLQRRSDQFPQWISRMTIFSCPFYLNIQQKCYSFRQMHLLLMGPQVFELSAIHGLNFFYYMECDLWMSYGNRTKDWICNPCSNLAEVLPIIQA